MLFLAKLLSKLFDSLYKEQLCQNAKLHCALENHTVISVNFRTQFHDAKIPRLSDQLLAFEIDKDCGHGVDRELAAGFGDCIDIDIVHGQVREMRLNQLDHLGLEAFAHTA